MTIYGQVALAESHSPSPRPAGSPEKEAREEEEREEREERDLREGGEGGSVAVPPWNEVWQAHQDAASRMAEMEGEARAEEKSERMRCC